MPNQSTKRKRCRGGSRTPTGLQGASLEAGYTSWLLWVAVVVVKELVVILPKAQQEDNYLQVKEGPDGKILHQQ